MSDFRSRLEEFLSSHGETLELQQLTPDASTREYFRVEWKGDSAIACVYPEAFIEAEQSYLDVTRLFRRAGLPVAEIYAFDERLGVILMEDLGDRILRDEIADGSQERAERLRSDAIALIPRIQAATAAAYDSGSIASKLTFDTEKLSWELDFFKTHYFATLQKRPLAEQLDLDLATEFLTISQDLEARAAVLCHRDFHAANLMIDKTGQLRIIDHQDARMGSIAYDLVSLLLDRVTVSPSPEWLAERRREFLKGREDVGLPKLDEDEFADEFRLQTIQRCLKAVGTFSYQSAVRGKTYFLPFIRPMFEIVHRATRSIGRFPILNEVLEMELRGNTRPSA